MQIPASAIAAGISSISTGKADRASTTEAPAATPAHVEGSEQSNPDRDAQGQGDGLGPRGRAKHTKSAHSASETAESAALNPSASLAPTLPDEPPSQLDLMG